ncbi:MAG TPA: hypothetical protein VL944_02915 [Candidatus Acidoferrum sp.]|nr:hypothetical protein [Candidatus Acidoferrum sp.]
MTAAVYEIDAAESESLKKFLEYDPYLDKSLGEEELKKLNTDKEANVIFSRQEYSLRDGASLGLQRGKFYLYIKANDDFLKVADAKLKKSFKSAKRASREEEEKFISVIEEEQNRGNAGIGMIFGG